MGHAGIAPIEEGDAAVSDQDIPIVKIPMIKRLGDAVAGQIAADLFEARSFIFYLLPFGGCKALLLIDHQTFFICKKLCEKRGQHAEPMVWEAQGEQFGDMVRKPD